MTNLAVKFGLGGGGAFFGRPIPPCIAGKFYWPQHTVPLDTTMTVTAGRLYRTWFVVDRFTTFAGGWTYNSGTGDSGKKLRIGVWDDAGVLKKDFGEVTLNGSSAVRQAANPVTLTPGLYQVGIVFDTTPAMYCIQAIEFRTNVGLSYPNPYAAMLGSFAVPVVGQAQSNPIGDYASFTYGALPDPITTATATIINFNSATVGGFPILGLYV